MATIHPLLAVGFAFGFMAGWLICRWRERCVLFALAFAGSAIAGPSEAVAAAARDLATQPEALRPSLRYLTTFAVGVKERADFHKAMGFWSNSLSTEADIVALVSAGETLYRVNIEDYGWSFELWEKLAKADPYFHATVKRRTRVGKRVTKTASQVGLPVADIEYLVEQTNSDVPIVRADWFLVQTSQQDGRKGTGYFDFLGVKNRADFERVVGLDKKASIRLNREIMAIVARSTVALHNRQIVRFQSITGPYWVTLDSNKNTGRNNAIRNLDKDYLHDAEEHYGTLPNGLPAYYLSDVNGVQQNTAPDTIASDGQAPGTDRRVHVGISCVRCHVEVIRPIDDVARKLYTPPVALQSPSYKKFKRLQQLYVSDLRRWIVRDQTDYAEAIMRASGATTLANSKAFSKAVEKYSEADVDAAQLAVELGTDAKTLLATVQRYALATGQADPVVAALLHDPPLKIRRDHVEESFSLLCALMQEYKP